MIIEILQPEGLVLDVALKHSTKNMYVAWAKCEWITRPNGDKPYLIRVWLIVTREGYRRRGYATKIIKFLKQEKGCDIETDLGPLGSIGSKVFLKQGFEIVKAKNKYEVDKVVWKNSPEKK